MEIIDLKPFSLEEIQTVFIDLVNTMQKDGNRYMTMYEKSGQTDLEAYSYGAALLTKVNLIKSIIAVKNRKVKVGDLIEELQKLDIQSPLIDSIEPLKEYLSLKKAQ